MIVCLNEYLNFERNIVLGQYFLLSTHFQLVFLIKSYDLKYYIPCQEKNGQNFGQ